MSITVKKVATRVSFALATAALLVPVSVSPDHGVQENTACADGACCAELTSICGVDDPMYNAYMSSTGSCEEEAG